MTRWFLLLFAIVQITGTQAFSQGGPPPAKVVLDEARIESVTDRRVATGEIRSPMQSQLAVQVEGLVVEMLVDEGDIVKEDQIIAQIDKARAQIELEKSRANEQSASALIEQRRAELDQAQRDLDRIVELELRGSAGASERDDAETLLASRKAVLMQAEADLLTAQAETRLSERTLNDTTIRAPFSGQIIQTHTERGQWIARGGAVATVISLKDLEARVDIPQQYFAAVNGAGAEIEVVVPAINSSVTGTLISIVPRADSLSRLFPVRIRLHDLEGLLRPGMSVKAMVPTGETKELLTVSKDAIVRTASGEHLFFDSNGVAAITPIVRLFGVGDRVAIHAGMLKPGMNTIVDGNERMFPGQPLIVLDQPVPAIKDDQPDTNSKEQG